MYRIIGVAAGFMVAIFVGWPGEAAAQASTVWRYRLKVEPQADRTDLVVDAEISGTGDQTIPIGLPQDCYGSPDLHRAVTRMEGLAGSQVAAGADAAHRTLSAGADGVVRVRYRLSYDPAFYAGYAFGPNTGPAHLHLGGCQWMLAPADGTAPFDYEIGFAEKPEGWTLYSSLAADAATASGRASYEDLAGTALGGGTSHRRLGTAHGPVDIFIAESPEMDEARALDAVATIVRAQRDRFGAEGQEGFYIVSVNPRPGVLAGSAIDHLFVTFVRPDASQGELLNLIAHEMFHN